MPTIICVRRALIGLGVTEFLLGLAVTICGGVSILVKSRYYTYFHGFWGGGAYMIIGLFAIFAGWKKSKGCEMAHMVSAILGASLLYMALSTLWMAEISSDGFASYYEDPPLCQNGCAFEKSTDSFLDFQGTWETETPVEELLGSSGKLYCEGLIWRSTCSPNEEAVYVSFACVFIAGVLFVLHIVSACYSCCIVCHCCGVRDESIKPYPQYTQFNNHGPMHGQMMPAGYAVAPMSMGGYGPGPPHQGQWNPQPQRHGGRSNQPLFPEVGSITSEAPIGYVPDSNELDENFTAPEPVKPEPVTKTPVPSTLQPPITPVPAENPEVDAATPEPLETPVPIENQDSTASAPETNQLVGRTNDM